MVDDTESAVWPLPKFYFSVDFDDQQKNIPFQEVSGLDAETQIIEYRADDSKGFDTIKMPGIVKVGNVTFKRGIFINNNEFFDWFSKIKMNTIKRETITIKLLDESGKPTMVWTLSNAWPTKITGTDLKSDGNEVAVETLEFAYEIMTTEAG